MGAWNIQGQQVILSDTAPSVTPEGIIWSDTTTNTVKVSDGGAFNQVGKTSFASAAVVSQSTTIGDYTTPSTAVGSTQASTAGDAIFGTSADQVIDDFTTYATQGAADAKWVSANTAKSRVNITNDNIAFDFEDNVAGDTHIYKDRGSAISNTLWTLRFKINFSVSLVNSRTWFGIASDTTSQAIVKDFIGVLFHDTAGSAPSFKTADTDLAALPTAGDSTSAAPLALNTTYGVSISRTSATAYTVSVYSDANYQTLIETISGTCASTTDTLRYISFYNRNDFDSTNNQVGTVDDVQFWNGVASPVLVATNTKDGDTATRWASISEANPSIYADMGSALNLCAAAFYWDGTNTTETQIVLQTSADASTWVTKRTITTSGLTNGAYNYYRFNIAAGARYVRFRGSSGSTLVLSIYEIKILKKTDTEIFNDLGLLEISTSSTSLTAAGT